MKQLDRINFRHSFAAKICLWMLITSACVFLVCFGTASWFASKMMLDDGHKKANLELDKAILYGTGTKMPLGIVTRLAQSVQPET